jgi:hypothetical protein
MIFLCGGGNQPTCPAATSGTISGTITAANVTGPATQGIAAGDLTSALEAVREGNAYANMHTDNFKGVRFAAKSAAAIVVRGRGWKGNAMRRFRGRRPPRPAIAENRESDPSLERREAS